MELDYKAETENLNEILSAQYGMKDVPYDIDVRPNIDYFIKYPNRKGFCSKIDETQRWRIGLNRNLLTDKESLKRTLYHEFRHLWQRVNADKYNIEHWICWDTNNKEKLGEDAYRFSPTEMDANRFARSNGTLDDYEVFIKCESNEKPHRELEKNMSVAKEIAFSEGIYLLNEDTVQRLMEMALYTNHEEYAKWLEVQKKELRKKPLHLTGQLHNIGVERTFL